MILSVKNKFHLIFCRKRDKRHLHTNVKNVAKDSNGKGILHNIIVCILEKNYLYVPYVEKSLLPDKPFFITWLFIRVKSHFSAAFVVTDLLNRLIYEPIQRRSMEMVQFKVVAVLIAVKLILA